MDGLQGLAMEGSSAKKEKKVLKIVLYLLFSFCFLVDFACFVGFIVVYYHFFCMLIERIYFVEQAPTHPALTLSSDSDSPPKDSPLREGKEVDSPFNGTPKVKSPIKRLKAKDPKSTNNKQKINNHKKKEGISGGQYINFMFFLLENSVERH